MEDTKIYIDPSTNRKGKILNERIKTFEGIPLFSMIELNLLARCNRTCHFCPVSSKSFYEDFYNNDRSGKIEIELFEKLLKDLVDIDYNGMIMFSGLSEPLLHPKIYDLIKISKEFLPKTLIEINSNGDTVNKKRLEKLFTSGLDTLSISLYDGPQQITYFNELKKELGIADEKMILRRRYFENDNYGLTISNRAGLIDSNKYRSKGEKNIDTLPLKKSCYYPFYMLKIDFNGDVIICTHDWKKEGKIGNINKDTIFKIWTNNHIKSVRKKLANKKRNFSPCNKCDVYGDVMGKEHFDLWNTIYLDNDGK